MDELQTKETKVASHILPQYFREDGRSLAGNKAVGGWRGGGDGKMNRLIGAKNMLGGDAGAESADIQGLS